MVFLFYDLVWVDYYFSLFLVWFALPVFVVLCFAIAFPMHKINNFINKQKNLEKPFVLIIGSLIIYTFVQIPIAPLVYANDILAIIIFAIILGAVIAAYFIYNHLKAEK